MYNNLGHKRDSGLELTNIDSCVKENFRGVSLEIIQLMTNREQLSRDLYVSSDNCVPRTWQDLLLPLPRMEETPRITLTGKNSIQNRQAT